MKPKEQTFDRKNNYVENLVDWICAIARLPFVNDLYFETRSTTKELLSKDKRIFKNEKIIIKTGMFDEQPSDEYIFYTRIVPLRGREDYDGICIIFEENNLACFSDWDYDNYEDYFKDNGLSEEKITWQEAYDKLCELARKEQNSIPKLK